MTEKRFSYNVNKNTIEQDGKFVAYVNCIDGCRIANKLNVFQKENEKLKRNYNSLSHNNGLLHDECSNKISALKKENEQLKKENKKLQSKYDKQLWQYNGLGCEYDWLKEENEQLKEESKLFQCMVVEIFDFIDDNDGVSVEEMEIWWEEKEKELEND